MHNFILIFNFKLFVMSPTPVLTPGHSSRAPSSDRQADYCSTPLLWSALQRLNILLLIALKPLTSPHLPASRMISCPNLIQHPCLSLSPCLSEVPILFLLSCLFHACDHPHAHPCSHAGMQFNSYNCSGSYAYFYPKACSLTFFYPHVYTGSQIDF